MLNLPLGLLNCKGGHRAVYSSSFWLKKQYNYRDRPGPRHVVFPLLCRTLVEVHKNFSPMLSFGFSSIRAGAVTAVVFRVFSELTPVLGTDVVSVICDHVDTRHRGCGRDAEVLNSSIHNRTSWLFEPLSRPWNSCSSYFLFCSAN